MASATRVACDKKDDGNSNDGRRQGWRASDSDKGDGKDVGNGNGNEASRC